MTMSWRYESSTGVLTSPDGSRQDTGYSGHPPHVNDPAAEAILGVGPIPRGSWWIGTAEDHPQLGPDAIPLSPVRGTDATWTYGRSGFFIHGDSEAMNQTASHGCVIVPRVVRELIAASGDSELQVI